MPQQPWATGPGEILQHGLSLLQKDRETALQLNEAKLMSWASLRTARRAIS